MSYFAAAMFTWAAFLNYSRGGVLIMNRDPTARKFYAAAFMALALMSLTQASSRKGGKKNKNKE
jgi:hypothetical protein